MLPEDAPDFSEVGPFASWHGKPDRRGPSDEFAAEDDLICLGSIKNKFEVEVCSRMFLLHGSRPNRFHRFFQWLFLGFKWHERHVVDEKLTPEEQMRRRGMVPCEDVAVGPNDTRGHNMFVGYKQPGFVVSRESPG